MKSMNQYISESNVYAHAGDWPQTHSLLHPASLKKISVCGFLGRRIDLNKRSILAGLESPIPRNFEASARGGQPCRKRMCLAADSDLYKWIEGAAYEIASSGDAELLREIERISSLVIGQQQPDGHINTQVPPLERLDQRHFHDLYLAGHFFEAAVAHSRATGKTNMLTSARRWADWLIRQYETNHPYFREVGEREHPEAELGLLRLYRATGEQRYLDFAITLTRMYKVGETVRDLRCGAGGRHSVRVLYHLAARAELYLETGNNEFLQHLRAIWQELVSTRMYITGGIGYNESIPLSPYDLPQSLENSERRDIAETCASVAMMMFSWRMHAITGDSRYFDIIERVLYNHFLGALSLDNLGIFYYNPIRLIGDQTGRTDHDGSRSQRTMLPNIHSTSCCIPNTWRFLAALREYLFSVDERGIYINLYTKSVLEHSIKDTYIKIEVDTEYPHEGAIAVRLNCEKTIDFVLRLRVPDWCHNARLHVSGEKPKKTAGGAYVEIERTWKDGDRVNLDLDMPVRMVFSHPWVLANAGSVAFARGPLIYCLEKDDVGALIEQIRITVRPDEIASVVQVEWRPELLCGVYVLRVPATIVSAPQAKYRLYYEAEESTKKLTALLVPFYARANRSASARWLTLLPQGPK